MTKQVYDQPRYTVIVASNDLAGLLNKIEQATQYYKQLDKKRIEQEQDREEMKKHYHVKYTFPLIDHFVYKDVGKTIEHAKGEE